MGVATAITVGMSLASAGAGFAQAAKEKKLMRDAQEAAAKYMEDAKNKLSVNYMEGLQVPLEGYEAAARQNLALGMQSTDALIESGQRAVLGGSGTVNAQGQAFAEDQRFKMQQDLYNRDKLIAQEEMRIANQLAGIGLQEASGAQIAAAEADRNRRSSIQGAFSNIGTAATDLLEGLDLYKKDKSDTPEGQPGLRANTGQFGSQNSSMYNMRKASPSGVTSSLDPSAFGNSNSFSSFSVPGVSPYNQFIYDPYKN